MTHSFIGLASALTGAPLLPDSQSCLLVLALLSAGAVAGIMAGLFGIGGGTVIVPVLYETFGWFSIADDIRMPLCIGTSLAVIVPTSVFSAQAHWKRGCVDTKVLKAWSLPVIVGALAGSFAAHFAADAVFKATFIFVALLTALRLLLSDRLVGFNSDLPSGPPMVGYGVTIGASSALIGIGGGLVANMVMALHGRKIHQAVATSSAIGVLVSLPGTLGYVVAGWGNVELPPYSLGFVSVVGFMVLMPTCLVMAKVGAGLAHKLSKAGLESAFAVYLVLVSLRFSWSMLVA